MDFSKLKVEIPEAAQWHSATPLTARGIGPDKKFLVRDRDGRKLLLRLADGSEFGSKKRIFELSSQVWQKSGIAIPEPLSVGQSRDGNHAYIVLSWLEGEDFDATLSSLSDAQHLECGLESGRMLRRIHDSTRFCEPQSGVTPIEEQMDELFAWYRQLGEPMPHDAAVIAYLHENLPSMQTRPQAILHGDFHLGNFVLQPDGSLGLIDFDFIRIGDPLEETRMMLYTLSQGHVSLVNGQFNGYFGGHKPDEEFFRVMAFYAALGLFGSLRWQLGRGYRDALARSTRGFAERFQQFNGFRSPIPNWYRAP